MVTCSGGGAQCRRVGLTHRCSALPKLSPSIAGGGWAPQCVTPGNPFLAAPSSNEVSGASWKQIIKDTVMIGMTNCKGDDDNDDFSVPVTV